MANQKIWVNGFASKQYTAQKIFSTCASKMGFARRRGERRGRGKGDGGTRKDIGVVGRESGKDGYEVGRGILHKWDGLA